MEIYGLRTQLKAQKGFRESAKSSFGLIRTHSDSFQALFSGAKPRSSA